MNFKIYEVALVKDSRYLKNDIIEHNEWEKWIVILLSANK